MPWYGCCFHNKFDKVKEGAEETEQNAGLNPLSACGPGGRGGMRGARGVNAVSASGTG